MSAKRERVPECAKVDDAAKWLREHHDEWWDLAAGACDRNAFYEPPLLEAALDSVEEARAVSVVLIFDDDRLDGLFPIVKRRNFRGLPMPYRAMWTHSDGPRLGTPLLRRSVAAATLTWFMNWLDAAGGGAFFEFSEAATDGEFWPLLVDATRQRENWEPERYDRALLRPPNDADAYLREAISPNKRRQLRRLRRRLADAGEVRYEALDAAIAPAAVEDWLDEFIALEDAGWKGSAGTSLRASGAAAGLRRAAQAAFAHGSLDARALRLDGEPVAMRIGVISGDGEFALKMAYDETKRKLSPGSLLEIESLEDPKDSLRWIDSCSGENHPNIDMLWSDRREIVSLVVSRESPVSRLVVRALPLLKRLKGRFGPTESEQRSDTRDDA